MAVYVRNLSIDSGADFSELLELTQTGGQVVNLTGLLTLGSGEGLKYFETGRAQFYALIVFGGVIALVALFGVVGA